MNNEHIYLKRKGIQAILRILCIPHSRDTFLINDNKGIVIAEPAQYKIVTVYILNCVGTCNVL